MEKFRKIDSHLWESKRFYLSWNTPSHPWEYVLTYKKQDTRLSKGNFNDPRYTELKEKLSAAAVEFIISDRGSRLEFSPAPWRADYQSGEASIQFINWLGGLL